MFTPFAFIQTPSAAGGIVTDQLAFSVDPANGNFNDTVGGKTGTQNGTVTTVNDNYWSGFSSANYISYASTADLNDDTDSEFSIEAWFFYPNSFGASAVKIPFSINSTTVGAEYRFRYLGSDNGNIIQSSIPTFIDSDISNASSYRGAWTHNVMIFKFNGSTGSSTLEYSIQKVGSSVVTNTTTGFSGAATRRAYNDIIRIGRSTNDTVNFSDGFIGPVRIYNKALTTAEIAQNYDAQVSRFT
jgi:hypothetical protein